MRGTPSAMILDSTQPSRRWDYGECEAIGTRVMWCRRRSVMRTVLTGLVAIVVCALVSPAALACGDKFLVPIRGTRFERAPARRQPASVLVYAGTGSRLSNTLA